MLQSIDSLLTTLLLHTHTAQLYELRKTTLAKLICANSDDIEYVQKNAFRGESERYDVVAIVYIQCSNNSNFASNPVVHCKSLADTNLGPWKNAPVEEEEMYGGGGGGGGGGKQQHHGQQYNHHPPPGPPPKFNFGPMYKAAKAKK